MEKEKEKLAILQSDSVNEHVIRDEWSKHVSTRINCKIFPSKRSKKHDYSPFFTTIFDRGFQFQAKNMSFLSFKHKLQATNQQCNGVLFLMMLRIHC